MTTFAEHLQRDGRLLWWGLEVSFDNFATVDYRWATHSGPVEGEFFEERLVSIGNIQRGLGSNHLPLASDCVVELDNTDFVADWLLDPVTVASQVFKARFRVKLGLADPGESPTIVTQAIGTFVCLDFPARGAGTVKLTLADDSVGQLADSLVPPTPRDWFDSAPGTTDSVFPSNIGNVEPLFDWDVPAPLQFGKPFYTGMPLCTFTVDRTPADYDTAGGFEAGHRKYIYPILVLATRDDAAVAATDVTKLFGVFRDDVLTDPRGLAGKGPLSIPEFNGNQRIWKAYKTDTLTKDGYDWKLLWVAFDVLVYVGWLDGSRPSAPASSAPAVEIPSSPEYPPALFLNVGYQNTSTTFPFAALRTHFAAFDHFIVEGAPGSGITGKADLTNVGDPINILQDFVEHYSALGSSAVDATRFARAQLVTRILAAGSIIFGGANQTSGEQQLSSRRSPYGIGTLRKAIAELAASADLDVFMTMEGKVAVVAQGADFETQTSEFPTFAEERTNNVVDHIPSAGDRWSPYNRVFLASRDGQAGPYDDPGGTIASWGRVLPRVLGTKWWWSFNYPMPVSSAVDNVWNTRNLEAKVRPVITFTTDLAVLALELGDYFLFTWSRGAQNAAYSDALWRLEAVTIHPENGAVDVEAVWMGDLEEAQPFLLDNEDLFTRVAAVFGRTATVTDGSDTVVFASGDLVADGVQPGDILRLRDAGEALTTFFRNRDIRIDHVDDVVTLILDAGADLDFGTAGAHVVAEWSIVRSAVTYPTTVDDPAAYPSGSEMFGKATDISGVFSDATTGNKLLDG